MPNFIAYAMMIVWPIVCMQIYKRYPITQAVTLSIMIPFLVLPVHTYLDIPGFTPINKEQLAGLILFFVLWAAHKKKIPPLPTSNLSKILLIGLVISPIFSVLTNQEALFYGPAVWPGVNFSGFLQIELDNIALFVVPFLAGYHFINTEERQKTFLKMFVIAGFIYTIPILFEIRMSPHLHSNLYGYHPHDFIQQMRAGGFRAMVFIGHGLLVAMFMAMVTLAAIFLYKEQLAPMKKFGYGGLAFLLFVVVVSKTMSALIYLIIFGAASFFLSRKLITRICFCVAALIMCYPALRMDYIPTDDIALYVKDIDEERYHSLKYRLDNEAIIVEHTGRKPLFGWSALGRNLVYDPQTGAQLSVVDGYWVLIFSSWGWVGYIIFFGLLCFPVMRVHMHYTSKKASEPIPLCLCAIVVMLTANLMDFIPNASFVLFTPLFAGAIVGFLDNKQKKIRRRPTTLDDHETKGESELKPVNAD